jgi:hypothetical protein
MECQHTLRTQFHKLQPNSVAAGGYGHVSTTTQPVVGTVPANQSAINAVQQGGGPSSSKTIKFANIAFAPLVLICNDLEIDTTNINIDLAIKKVF